MNNGDREVLAAIARLNGDMGEIVLSLLHAQNANSLAPGRLRDLAAICDEMSALLDNHADKLDGDLPAVIDSNGPDARPMPLTAPRGIGRTPTP